MYFYFVRPVGGWGWGRGWGWGHKLHHAQCCFLFAIKKKIYREVPATVTITYKRFICEFTNLVHYNDGIMSPTASQITSLAIVYSTVYSGADQGKHQSPVTLVFVRGSHRGPVNSPHKGPVTRKMFPVDDVIMVEQFDTYIWDVFTTSQLDLLRMGGR